MNISSEESEDRHVSVIPDIHRRVRQRETDLGMSQLRAYPGTSLSLKSGNVTDDDKRKGNVNKDENRDAKGISVIANNSSLVKSDIAEWKT
ncbi:hypothetical protein WA026_004808 [Henosepilachna vigintioctopunctata]|uniref:Uncharacterized protein n=1 Tax=Henosepilachna vigintioctopunctata TaxID=420089 RepID=A0AAW1UM53_9CUCU